jgi:DNA-binding PadR family transcriptional regulator
MAADLLGTFEYSVLRSLLHLGAERAYGMLVRKQLSELLSKNIAIGQIYATLDRLEEKKLVSSKLVEAGADRGGHPRRYYKVEASGRAAIRHTEAALSKLGALRPVGGVV